jgi:hypothetical protein
VQPGRNNQPVNLSRKPCYKKVIYF